jgi:flagellar hook-length control protein FliK
VSTTPADPLPQPAVTSRLADKSAPRARPTLGFTTALRQASLLTEAPREAATQAPPASRRTPDDSRRRGVDSQSSREQQHRPSDASRETASQSALDEDPTAEVGSDAPRESIDDAVEISQAAAQAAPPTSSVDPNAADDRPSIGPPDPQSVTGPAETDTSDPSYGKADAAPQQAPTEAQLDAQTDAQTDASSQSVQDLADGEPAEGRGAGGPASPAASDEAVDSSTQQASIAAVGTAGETAADTASGDSRAAAEADEPQTNTRQRPSEALSSRDQARDGSGHESTDESESDRLYGESSPTHQRSPDQAVKPTTVAEKGSQDTALPAADGLVSPDNTGGDGGSSASSQPPAPAVGEVKGSVLLGRAAARGSQGVRESAPASPTSGVDRARFLHRVSGALRLASQRDGHVHVRLSPPELGSLQLELSVKGGQLTASVETETAAARTTLLDNLPVLRQRLAEQGIQIERFDVDVGREGGQQPDFQSTERRDDSEASRRGPRPLKRRELSEEKPQLRPSVPTSGLDVRV